MLAGPHPRSLSRGDFARARAAGAAETASARISTPVRHAQANSSGFRDSVQDTRRAYESHATSCVRRRGHSDRGSGLGLEPATQDRLRRHADAAERQVARARRHAAAAEDGDAGRHTGRGAGRRHGPPRAPTPAPGRCGRRRADHLAHEGRRPPVGQGHDRDQGPVHRLPAPRRVRDAEGREGRRPGPREQRRLPARAVRGAGPRQLQQSHLPGRPGVGDVRPVPAARERLAAARRVAGLRHHLHGAALQRRRHTRQAGRRHGHPQRHRRPQRHGVRSGRPPTRSSTRTCRRARKARSACRITGTPCTSGTSGSGRSRGTTRRNSGIGIGDRGSGIRRSAEFEQSLDPDPDPEP